MDSVEKELLRGEVDALVREVAEERFRHVAGIEPSPDLVRTFAARGRAAHRQTVETLEREGERDLARLVASLRAERAQAGQEEAWRAAEVGATGVGPDGPVALAEAQLAVTRERDRDRRLAFGRAVAQASAIAARDAAVETRARARAEVGLAPDWEAVVAADALLGATDDAYRDVLRWLARREVGLAPPPHGDLTRADVVFLVSLHGWAGLFPAGMLALALERSLAPLRLDLRALRIDDEGRPAKWPGAHAFEHRVSLRRQGGPGDWLGLFDAVGRALAGAHVAPSRRDPVAPATFGALLAGLLLDRGFLGARLEVERKDAADLVRALALRQLFRLRAAAAAFRVASEVERGTAGAAWHDAHREALTLAACATWPHGLASRDGDAGAAIATLRGAARAEGIRRSLVDRFDEDWWRNPRSAAAIGTVLAAPPTGADEPDLGLGARSLVDKLQ